MPIDEIAELKNELLDTANAVVDGKYIFAGYREDTKPFTANPAYETTRATINLEPGTSPNIATNDASANWSGLAADEVATHFSLWDDATAGNPWAFGAWDPTVALVLAGSAVVAAGKITLTLTVGT